MTVYANFELNSLRTNEITMKLLITDICGYRDTVKVSNDVIYKQWYDVMNCFAKFDQFLPHSIIPHTTRVYRPSDN